MLACKGRIRRRGLFVNTVFALPFRNCSSFASNTLFSLSRVRCFCCLSFISADATEDGGEEDAR